MTRNAVLSCALLLFFGCPDINKRVAVKSCQFNVRDVSIDSFTPLEVELTLTVGVYNPNEIEVIVDHFEYTVLVGRRKLADGQSVHELLVPPNQSRNLRVKVRANVIDAAMAIRYLRGKGGRLLTFRATSFVRVPWGVYEYPIELEQTF